MTSNALRVTMESFPESPAVLDGAGLPWGAVLQPFLPLPPQLQGQRPQPRLRTSQVPRCSECFAYCSAYSSVDYRWWRCALCGARNRLQPGSSSASIVAHSEQPYAEYDLDDDDDAAGATSRSQCSPAAKGCRDTSQPPFPIRCRKSQACGSPVARSASASRRPPRVPRRGRRLGRATR